MKRIEVKVKLIKVTLFKLLLKIIKKILMVNFNRLARKEKGSVLAIK
jgi:hypothetical protein